MELYSLNKDELIYLISTISAEQKQEIMELKNKIDVLEKTLGGHDHTVINCSHPSCEAFVSYINDRSAHTAELLEICFGCRNPFCRRHVMSACGSSNCGRYVCIDCFDQVSRWCINCIGVLEKNNV